MAKIATLLLLALICGLLSAGAPAAADPPAAAPHDPAGAATPEDVRAAVARLSEPELRALLVRVLEAASVAPASDTAGDAAPAPGHEPMTAVALVMTQAHTMHYRLGEMVAGFADLPSAMLHIVDRITRDREWDYIWRLLLGLAMIGAAGALAEGGFRRLFGAIGAGAGPADPPASDFGRLGLLCARALVDVLALGTFALAGMLVYFAIQPDDLLARAVFWIAFLTVLGVRAALIASRIVLAPDRPDLRLPATGDQESRALSRWIAAVVAVIAVAGAVGAIAGETGLPEPLMLAIGTVLQWLVVATLILFVWLKRRAIARLLGFALASRTRGALGFLADSWHLFVIMALVLVGLFAMASRLLTGTAQSTAILQSLALLVALPIADGLLRMLAASVLGIRTAAGPSAAAADDAPPTTAAEHPAAEHPAAEHPAAEPDSASDSAFMPVIVRNMRMVLAVVALILFGEIWNISLSAIASRSFGSRIAQALFDITVTLILASALWGVVKTAINRHVPLEEIDPQALAEGEGTGAGFSRVHTLLPLLRKFVFVILVVLVAMIVISALGIDIGPLLAGAGVIGIAVGFGAQSLVRDIVSGIFFLIDDAFRIGEYIDVGSAKGMVERISIRSLRLRHHLGQINTIPFGEIRHVTNFSRDWVIMKLELRIPYDTDLEKVRKLVKRVGQEMLQHPEHGPHFLQPVKSQGVHRMDDDAFIVRVKFMAKPGEQFVLRREVFRRLQQAFHENGIRFAPRRVIVDAAPDPQRAAAAAIAAQQGVIGAQPGKPA